jgi:hypothetical protein
VNLVLPYLWKEWRAQRGTLLAYTGLVFACLCLGLWLAPTHSWFEEGFGAHALSWFVLAGMLGVLFFVAPNLVRAEFTAKDDQFVRRLPGALWPAFGGKLLFLLLATIALPLLGLLVGEIFVMARGQNWDGLFRWEWDGRTRVDWPAEVLVGGAALLLLPWIWALGTWLPGGRMAVGATALFVLLLGVGVAAVLRQSPKIENGIDWQMWPWAVAPLGLCIAAMSWGIGRRGGGPLRSARFGLAATALGLVPPSVWFADRAWEYHHPDPAALATLDTRGLSPDGRFLLAKGAAHRDWYGAWFRIDLQDGKAEQISGIATGFQPELVRPYVAAYRAQQRHWLSYGEWVSNQRAFDLATGAWTPLEYDREHNERHLPPALREQVLAERRERTLLRAPGGIRVFVEGAAVCFEECDGTVSRVAVPELQGASVYPAGHGLFVKNRTFDLTSRRLLPDVTSRGSAFLVRGTLVYAIDTHHWRKWGQRTPDGELQAVEALAQCRVFGLFDDDHLLVTSWPNKQGLGGKLYLYRPADRSLVGLPLPDGVSTGGYLEEWSPLFERGSLLARDPGGGVWLSLATNTRREYLRIDAASRVVTNPFGTGRDEREEFQLLAFPDAGSALVRQGVKVLRVETASGRAEVLFPR